MRDNCKSISWEASPNQHIAINDSLRQKTIQTPGARHNKTEKKTENIPVCSGDCLLRGTRVSHFNPPVFPQCVVTRVNTGHGGSRCQNSVLSQINFRGWVSTLASNYHLQLVPGRAPLRTLLKVLITVDAAALKMHHHDVPDEGHKVGVLLLLLSPLHVAGLLVQLETEGGQPG